MLAALFLLATTLPRAEPTTPEDRAKALVAALADGRFADATKDFDGAFQKALPGTKLEDVWKQVTTQVRPFRKQLGVRVEMDDEHVIAYVRCQFDKAVLVVKVVFDQRDRVTGLNVLPAAPT